MSQPGNAPGSEARRNRVGDSEDSAAQTARKRPRRHHRGHQWGLDGHEVEVPSSREHRVDVRLDHTMLGKHHVVGRKGLLQNAPPGGVGREGGRDARHTWTGKRRDMKNHGTNVPSLCAMPQIQAAVGRIRVA